MAKKKETFREWRRRLEITQADIAAQAGVDQASVSRYEIGKPVSEAVRTACEAVREGWGLL